MPNRHNGGVVGKVNTPTLSVAKGVWNMNAVHKARLGNIWPVAAASGITFGAVSGTNTFAGSGSAKTVSLTLGAQANRMVICGIAMSGSASPSAVTFNGTSMTQRLAVTSLSFRTYLYTLPEASLPGAGSYNLSVTPDVGCQGGIWCIYIYGASQGAPEATGSSYSTSANSWTTNITTLTNNAWLVDCVCHYPYTMTPDGGQTERVDFLDGGSNGVSGSTKLVASAGATTVGWTPATGGDFYSHGVIAIAPA